MMSCIDVHRDAYGVEPIYAQLPIAPSTYYEHKARETDSERLPLRVRPDRELSDEIKRVWDENYQVYGAKKVWRQLKREQFKVARCTVERLLQVPGLQGAVRGKTCRTTVSDATAERPADLVNRQFTDTRPNQLWAVKITFVATWVGFIYVAFVIDVFARRIVGWRLASTMRTDLVLDALEQALWSRTGTQGLIHDSDRGSQYLSIRYTEHLAEVGIESSVGSTGDSYENALAETINGLYTTKVIRRRAPWRNIDDVEYATLEWVDWFNHRRLLEPICNVPPARRKTGILAVIRPAPLRIARFNRSIRVFQAQLSYVTVRNRRRARYKTEKQIRRGVFCSVSDLEEEIMQFIEGHNENPKPFVWTKPVDEIMAKIYRARLELSNAQLICYTTQDQTCLYTIKTRQRI